MNNQLNVYKRNQINTASSEDLVLMLYDGAKKFINRAIKSIDEKNIEEANHNLLRAQKIILGLMSGINFEAGDVANNMYALYEYMYHKLVKANLKKDAGIAAEVLQMVDELRTAWMQMLKNRYLQDEENFNVKITKIS
jgi:flagellar biosynthetic protein FliS